MRSYAHAAAPILAAGIAATLVSWFASEVPAPRAPSEADILAAYSDGDRRQSDLVGQPIEKIEPDSDRESRAVARSALRKDQLAVIESAPRVFRDVATRGSLFFAIRDSLDSPVRRARVSLGSGSRQRSGVTGNGGEVRFEDLAAGRYAYRIEAPARPLLTAAGPIELRVGELRRLELRLGEFDRVVMGRVVDQDRASVAGLAVKARLYRTPSDASVLVPQSQAEQLAETAADGAFEIRGLMAGEYEVRTIATDRYLAAKAIIRAGTDAVMLTVVERRELTVYGQVTNTDGEPLANVRAVHLGQPSQRARTDGEGWYELLVAVREGQLLRLRFDLEGYQPQRVDLKSVTLGGPDDTRLDATLEPVGDTVEVSARLVDEQGSPVAGERLYLHSYGLKTHYQAVSGADGTAWFPAVAPNRDYSVWVAPRGPHQDYTSEANLDDVTELEIVLKSLAAGSLSGHMIDLAGEPVPRFSLRLHSANARGKWRQVSGDADGYFEAQDVPTGSLTLQTASMPQVQITGVGLDAGDDAYVEVVLDWGATALEGRVVDARGEPLPSAQVDLYWDHSQGAMHSRSTRRTIADGNGTFLFSRLGRAPRRLEASAPGHVTHQQTLQPGTEWVEVRLKPGEE